MKEYSANICNCVVHYKPITGPKRSWSVPTSGSAMQISSTEITAVSGVFYRDHSRFWCDSGFELIQSQRLSVYGLHATFSIDNEPKVCQCLAKFCGKSELLRAAVHILGFLPLKIHDFTHIL